MTRKLLMATASAALLMGSVQPGHAAFELMLDDGVGHTATITDQGAGDANLAVGAITFIGAVGNFTINVSTGESKPVLGSSVAPEMDLNSIDTTGANGGGTLTLSLSDTGFTGSGAPLIFEANIGGTQSTGGPLTFNTFLDCGNAEFGTGTPLTSSPSLTSNAFSDSRSGPAACAGTYSLTEVVSLTITGGPHTTSFDANLKVPEPGTLALFGVGLLGIGAALRWRKRV